MCRAVFLLLSIVVLPACSNSELLRHLKVGMRPNEVVALIGEPRAARAAQRDSRGQLVEVWEYRLRLPLDDSPGEIIGKVLATIFTLGAGAVYFIPPRRDYWLIFREGALATWGQAGDWQYDPQNAHSIEIRRKPALVR